MNEYEKQLRLENHEKELYFMKKFNLKKTFSRNKILRKLTNPKFHRKSNEKYYPNELHSYCIDHHKILYNPEFKCYIIVSCPYVDIDDFYKIFNKEIKEKHGYDMIDLDKYNYYGNGSFMFAMGLKENLDKIFKEI